MHWCVLKASQVTLMCRPAGEHLSGGRLILLLGSKQMLTKTPPDSIRVTVGQFKIVHINFMSLTVDLMIRVSEGLAQQSAFSTRDSRYE